MTPLPSSSFHLWVGRSELALLPGQLFLLVLPLTYLAFPLGGFRFLKTIRLKAFGSLNLSCLCRIWAEGSQPSCQAWTRRKPCSWEQLSALVQLQPRSCELICAASLRGWSFCTVPCVGVLVPPARLLPAGQPGEAGSVSPSSSPISPLVSLTRCFPGELPLPR